jgi:uncharacterized membrane protein
MSEYLSVKWVHILSSTVLFGTGAGYPLLAPWLVCRDKRGQRRGSWLLGVRIPYPAQPVGMFPRPC